MYIIMHIYIYIKLETKVILWSQKKNIKEPGSSGCWLFGTFGHLVISYC